MDNLFMFSIFLTAFTLILFVGAVILEVSKSVKKRNKKAVFKKTRRF